MNTPSSSSNYSFSSSGSGSGSGSSSTVTIETTEQFIVNFCAENADDYVYSDPMKQNEWIQEFSQQGARRLAILQGAELAQVLQHTTAPVFLVMAMIRAANRSSALSQEKEDQRMSVHQSLRLSRRKKSADDAIDQLRDKLDMLKVMADIPDEIVGLEIKKCGDKIVAECTICNLLINLKGNANFSYLERHLLGDKIKTGNFSAHLSRAYRKKYDDEQWASIHTPIRAQGKYKESIINQVQSIQQDMRHRAD